MGKLVVIIFAAYLVYFINSSVVKLPCGPNESQVDCGHCGPKHCDDLGYPMKCAGSTARCTPECVCIDGHVRNANNTCIPKNDCPSCGGDKNATSGCGNHCGNSCSDYKETNKTCFSGCRGNSCDCRPGYVFHDTFKSCVLPIDCCEGKPVASQSCSTVAFSGHLDLKTKDEDHTCTMNLSACEIKMGRSGTKGENGVPGLPGRPGHEGGSGTMGEKGEPGLPGDPGYDGGSGTMGEKGEPGLPGYPGYDGSPGRMGSVGIPGEKGDRGERGWPGLRGLVGVSGYQGLPGENGEKGDNGGPGPIGPPGIPGLDGQCLTLCPERYSSVSESSETLGKEDAALDIGTRGKPSDNACHVIRDDDTKPREQIWVYPGHNKFEVKCKGPLRQHTCLILKPVNTTLLDEMAFHTGEDKTENFWLSNYIDSKTKKPFDLTELYNNVTKTQLTWLRNQMKQVTQTIRYHCKNSFVMEDYETALQLYSWNDISIGPTPSDRSPIAYSVMPGAKHECTADAPKNEWRYTDITVRGSTDRLPIIDFQIRDNRKENQYFYIELLDVCFG